jgi:hypothetical protein
MSCPVRAVDQDTENPKVASLHQYPLHQMSRVEMVHTIEWFDVRMDKDERRIVEGFRVKVHESAIFHGLSHQHHRMECFPKKFFREISPMKRQCQLSSRSALSAGHDGGVDAPPSFVSLR